MCRPTYRLAGSLIVFITTMLVVTDGANATKFAGEPYHLGVGARALGRGGAYVASPPDASSMFWNVASLAVLSRPEAMAQHAETFGSLLDHDFVAVAVPSRPESPWAWGVYGTYLGGSGIKITEVDSLRGRPVAVREENHGDWSLAVGLARKTSRWWHWGVALKTVIRDLPGNMAYGLGLDLAWYGQGRGWRAGIKAADITTTFLSYDSGRNESINPHVNWGGEVDLPEVVNDISSIVAVEAETYFEGRETAAQFWSGPISVDLHVGFEAAYQNLLYGRIGSDAGRLALGAGVAFDRWAIDAALGDHEFLDNSYRVSLRYILK
ncbi:MAG: hypothetical protein GF341_05000 [candidate division Zixibacteria bacterium]|nr:hypothetical protein [candidate division Zixibacteria bacterium]